VAHVIAMRRLGTPALLLDLMVSSWGCCMRYGRAARRAWSWRAAHASDETMRAFSSAVVVPLGAWVSCSSTAKTRTTRPSVVSRAPAPRARSIRAGAHVVTRLVQWCRRSPRMRRRRLHTWWAIRFASRGVSRRPHDPARRRWLHQLGARLCL